MTQDSAGVSSSLSANPSGEGFDEQTPSGATGSITRGAPSSDNEGDPAAQQARRKWTVTLIEGDGIGPEVMAATRMAIEQTKAPIQWEIREAGAKAFARGVTTGVPEETIASLRQHRVALKGPLETPVGYGGKSANVTLRKLFETFGNVRPVRELAGVVTPYSGRGIDFVVVRENVEDLYAGIEHQQTPEVAQCLKLISSKGCEKVIRLAFELARSEGRKSVHCATKANIMKLTEGMMKRTFERVSADYPEIEAYHLLVDDCAHKLVRQPEKFDVVVTTNMNGDILSDLAAGLVGGLGIAPSANLGQDIAIFEPVHGSAPDIAGRGIANPTAAIGTGILMLRYLGLLEEAKLLEDALLYSLESGVHTADLAGVAAPLSTMAFAEAIVANLGKQPSRPSRRSYRQLQLPKAAPPPPAMAQDRVLVGADVFVQSPLSADELGRSLEGIAEPTKLKLKMISNRGTRVYPDNGASTDCVDHWRCRFVTKQGSLDDESVLDLARRIGRTHTWMHIEKLQEYGGERGYTLAQGETMPGDTQS